MKGVLKSTGYYLLILQLFVLATTAANVLVEFVLAFFLKNAFWTLAVKALLGLVLELLLCFFFIKGQVGKQTTQKDIFLPFAIALALHFVIALANTFYVYTAGVAANSAALLWESAVRGEPAVMADVAFWRRILTFLPVKALLLLTAFVSFKVQRKSNVS